MGKPTTRLSQWLSQTLRVVLPGDRQPLRITLEAPRPLLVRLAAAAEIQGANAPWIIAWFVAGGLLVASDPAARVRCWQGVVSLRLGRLGTQTKARVVNPIQLDPLFRAQIAEAAFSLGLSSDLEMQRRALRWFSTDLLTSGFPPFRILVAASDLARVRVGLEASPLSLVLQLFLMGIAPLFRHAEPQPRGRQARTASTAPVMRFLACVADELIRQGGPRAVAIRGEARKAGYAGALGRLQLVQYLVERALRLMKGRPLELQEGASSYDDFARIYLYPYRARLRDLPKKVLAVPGLCEKLFGLTLPQPAKIRI